MGDNASYRIRPAGRHLLTIGRDLIQDSYAAVVELVKNAYDADSEDVEICFQGLTDKKNFSITVSDHGHGMSRDTVISKWMVPSTKDKLNRKISPAGRVMQGRKGVGRYAASVLGSSLLLETVSKSGEKTTVYVEWDSFENAEYLDDVEILVETEMTTEAPCTNLYISGTSSYFEEWDKKQFDKLRFELKKLIPPISEDVAPKKSETSFKIFLSITDFPSVDCINENIEPYPIFKLFDYKISGEINSDGKGVLLYSQQKARNTVNENLLIDLGKPTGCGKLVFDIRVYDREPEAIESLITRGLKDEKGNYLGKLQARQLLNESNGIGVYRNGFRIRPLGDADFDWLKLNEQRVQNPSMKIGSNQAIGYVLVQPEEQSNLIEKSARDGLRENLSYENLKEITKKVLSELENRRFSYRRKAGLSKKSLKIESELEKVFSFDNLRNEIKQKMIKSGVPASTASAVIELIDQEEEQKGKAVEEIRQAVATYQGQATLGKIINVVLHEGRRPLNYFRNEVPRLERIKKKFLITKEDKYLKEISQISEGVGINSLVLSDLFKKIDPLATARRSKAQNLILRNEINKNSLIFRNEFRENEINFFINGGEDIEISGWAQDIHAIFTNLIENSIFWITEKSPNIREISIDINSSDGKLSNIDYRDTGPGIEPYLIENEAIFEPQFSTKIGGTGIGLAIAGEASDRIGLKLEALQSDSGAYFRLNIKD